MEFRILGPLEVVGDGHALDAGGAKQRALLAVLLLNANRVVSSDGLIDALWEERAPVTAAKAVQVHVSQLRKLLGPNRVATRSPGYTLRVDEGELDVHQFEALVRRARDASPAEAATALGQALALWRGPPLADFAFDRFAQAEIARLEELRLDATEERLESELTLGRHRALVGELEALVAEHPLRERIRGQLMLALYRSGRQAEALESYQVARRVLVEELGIEPGRPLRELEQAILRQDASLDVSVEAEPEAGRSAPEVEELEASRATHERKLATILFADLEDSTELGQRDPERTRAELERLHDAMGRGSPIACRGLLRALSMTRPRGIGGVGRAFVGREEELELLRSAYKRVVHGGEPHLVTVMGDAGVGKTSLTRRLSEWLAAQSPEPLLRGGRCLPYGRGITYWPLGEVLRDHVGVIESDPPETVRQRLGERGILGMTLGLDIATGLHPLVARERLYEAWIELLDELVAARPTVVLVEDLHWAEEPLLDLLDRLLRDVSGPLLLLATSRPELLDSRTAWGAGHRNATQIWLEPLSLEEATRMLEQLLGSELPARLRQLVVEQAEGNPFFVEELVAALMDRGYLVRNGGGWQLRDLPARPSVPDSIESILAARIDLLGPAEKAALQAASVIGRVFWADPVQELIGGADADLGVLVQRGFIRRRPVSSMAGEREFAFKHGLTRDVAYESLPKASRAHLHAAFAAWIERVGVGRDEHAPLLAHHYAEAVRPDDVDLAWPGEEQQLETLRAKARTWLRRAAQLAGARYALDDQISLLGGAVELEPSPIGQVRLWREIAHANALNYDDEAFKDALVRAIEACSDQRQLMELYAEYAFQCAVRWQQEVDRPRIDEWSRVVLELGGPDTRARAQALVASAICHPEEAEVAARKAETIAARLDDPELHSYALYIRADVALAAAAFDEAQRIVGDRLELLDRIDDPDHRADACWAALPAYLGNGRFDDARRIAGLHDEITERLTPHHRLHGVAVLLEVEQLAGDWERIRELTARAEQAVEQSTTRCVHNRLALLTCALASACLGEEDEARRLETRSEESGIDLFGRAESLIWLSLHRRDLTAVERLLGELEQPRKSFLRSRKLAPVAARLDALAALGRRETLEHDAPPLLRPGTYLEPFALRALGAVREDEDLAEHAAERFEAMGLDWHAAQTRAQPGAPSTLGPPHPRKRAQ